MGAAYFQLITGQLYKMGPNEILRHHVLEHEILIILNEAHAGISRDHYDGKDTMQNILQVGLWWPTMHADSP